MTVMIDFSGFAPGLVINVVRLVTRRVCHQAQTTVLVVCVGRPPIMIMGARLFRPDEFARLVVCRDRSAARRRRNCRAARDVVVSGRRGAAVLAGRADYASQAVIGVGFRAVPPDALAQQAAGHIVGIVGVTVSLGYKLFRCRVGDDIARRPDPVAVRIVPMSHHFGGARVDARKPAVHVSFGRAVPYPAGIAVTRIGVFAPDLPEAIVVETFHTARAVDRIAHTVLGVVDVALCLPVEVAVFIRNLGLDPENTPLVIVTIMFRMTGSIDGVAQEAVDCSVVDGRYITLGIRDPADVALMVVAEGRPFFRAVSSLQTNRCQLVFRIILHNRARSGRVDNRGLVGPVFERRGADRAVDELPDQRHPPVGGIAEPHVGAVGLPDPVDAVRCTVIGVVDFVDVVVLRVAVFRRQVDDDLGQAALIVMLIIGAGQRPLAARMVEGLDRRDAVARPDVFQIGAAKRAAIRLPRRLHLDELVAAVMIPDIIAGLVDDAPQPRARSPVDFTRQAVAVMPRPPSVAGVVVNRVVTAVAIGRYVDARLARTVVPNPDEVGLIPIQDLGPVGPDSLDRGTRCIMAAGQIHKATIRARMPCIDVAVAPTVGPVAGDTEAVIGPGQIDVRTAPDEEFVLTADEQVAGRCIDRDGVAAATLRPATPDAVRTQLRDRAALESRTRTRENRNHQHPP